MVLAGCGGNPPAEAAFEGNRSRATCVKCMQAACVPPSSSVLSPLPDLSVCTCSGWVRVSLVCGACCLVQQGQRQGSQVALCHAHCPAGCGSAAGAGQGWHLWAAGDCRPLPGSREGVWAHTPNISDTTPRRSAMQHTNYQWATANAACGISPRLCSAQPNILSRPTPTPSCFLCCCCCAAVCCALSCCVAPPGAGGCVEQRGRGR